MKITVFIALFFALVMSTVSAESPEGGYSHGGDRHHGDRGQRDPVAHLTEALSLSEDQAAQIEAIFAVQREEHKARREAQQGEREAHQAELCAKRADIEAQIIAVFTDEQAVQFADLKTQRAERMAERMEKRGDREGHGDRRPHRSSYMGDC